MNKTLSIEDVARELTEGLTEFDGVEKFNEVITGLKLIMREEQLTLGELRDKCWEDSNAVFQKIYG